RQFSWLSHGTCRDLGRTPGVSQVAPVDLGDARPAVLRCAGVDFSQRRLRRLRRTPTLRRLVAETTVSVDDLIAPLFVREGIDAPQPIASLPGVVQHTRESLRKEGAEVAGLRTPA